MAFQDKSLLIGKKVILGRSPWRGGSVRSVNDNSSDSVSDRLIVGEHINRL
jgi:hypothetical protein